MLCSNTDNTTPELDGFLKQVTPEKDKLHATNRKVRAKLTELTLMVLRVKPFQMRMADIFNSTNVEGVAVEEVECSV